MVDDVTLRDIKKEWHLDFDNNISKISQIVRSEYSLYVKDPTIYTGDGIIFETLQENCRNISPQLIPYSALTEIIFGNDMSSDSLKDKEVAESSFANIFEDKYEIYLTETYGIIEVDEDEDIFSSEILIDKRAIEKDKKEIEIVYKIIEHLKLAISQKEGLYEKQYEKINELDKNMEESQETLKTFENSINQVEEMKASINQVYPQFVAILGIFTSIMFAVLGGFNEIKTLAQSLSTVRIPKLLIFTSLLMLGVNFLVFLSYNAISKLTKLPIKSCCNDEHCECLFEEKHPTVYYSSIFFIYIMCVGFALRLYKYNDFSFNKMIDDLKGTDLLPLYLIIVPPLIYITYKMSKVGFKDKIVSWYKKRKEEKSKKNHTSDKTATPSVIKKGKKRADI